ncbi:hypothetical protein AB0N77_13050 [Streptomyces misionensis]|uniref:Gfo/Idh/MocA family protein n=1 Tax=Streptomyces misionensis TaxID=67331 RepID=UPI00341CA035
MTSARVRNRTDTHRRVRDAGRPEPRFTGLQGHVSPTTRWVRDLIAHGYVGEVLSSSMICSLPGGGATFTSASAYTADAANGATMMTIPFAHALDMQAVALGELTRTTATIATLRTQAVNTDTGEAIAKTAPDQIAVTGRPPGGAVASMHFRGGALRTTPFVREIDGTRGSLRITGDVGLPMSAALTVEGAHDQDALSPLELPAGYDRFPQLAGTPAHNVAHLYAEVAETLWGRDCDAPGFDHAVELHRSIEAIAHRGTGG